jgi:hypothetical protein
MLMLAVHQLALDEPAANNEDDLGMTWDVVYEHRTTDNYGFQLGLSSLMAGDQQELAVAPLAVEDPFRLWGQFTLTW